MRDERIRNPVFGDPQNALRILEKHGVIPIEGTSFPTIGILYSTKAGEQLHEARRILIEAGFVPIEAPVAGILEGIEVNLGYYVYAGIDVVRKLVDPEFVLPQPANSNEPTGHQLVIF